MKIVLPLIKQSVIFILFLIFNLIPTTKTYAQSTLLTIPDSKIYQEYYNLLESISNKNFAKQQSKLNIFLNSHPKFEKVYHKLFNIFIYYDTIEEGLNYFQQLTNLPQFKRNSYWILGKIYNFQQRPNIALKAYQEALSAGPLSFNLVHDYLLFQYSQFKQSEIPDTLIKNLSPDEKKIVSGLIFYSKSDFQNAIDSFNALSKEASQNQNILNILGYCYFNLRNYSKAENLFKKTLEISQNNNDLQSIARLYVNFSLISSRKNLIDNILSYLELAYNISDKINDWDLIQFIAWNRGFYFETNYDFKSAKNEFSTAINIARKFHQYRKAAYAGYHYAQNLFSLRDFNEAITAYDTSEKFARLSKDPSLLFRFKISKGDIYYYLNQNDLAKQIFQEALDVATAEQLSRLKHIAKVRLANVFVRKGEFYKSRVAYQNYINYINDKKLHRRESEAHWLWKLAQTYFSEKNYDKAKTLFLQAKESATKHNKKGDYEWATMRLAELYEKTENYTEALNLYDEILTIAKANNKMSELSEIYLGLGNIYRKQNFYSKAITHYLLAAEIIEKTRRDLQIEQFKIGYFRDENRVYKNLVQCYLNRYMHEGKQALLDSLFYYDQLARGRSLQELKLKKKLPKGTESNNLIYHQYLKACLNLRKGQRDLRLQTNINSIDDLNSKLSQIEADKYSLIEQRLRLGGDKNNVNVEASDTTICSLSTAQENLKKENIGLLLFNISDAKSFVLAINDSINKIIILKATADSLKTMIDSLMTPFHNVKQKSVKQIAFKADISFRLYKLLIEPVEKEIQLPKKILIVSDRELLNLPFEMLLSSKPNDYEYTPIDVPDYKDYFLLQKYSFSYAPSTSFLNKTPKQFNGKSKFLLIANPFRQITFSENFRNLLHLSPRWQFPPLPNADIEANKIQEHVNHIEIFRHEKATESLFFEKAPEQQFIHLAAHGFVDLFFDAFSGIAFAAGDDSTDDGLLLGYEISDLDLKKCDLITLSACETGRGKTVAGEGVLGLPRLFLGAGAKSVLMTLWHVDDKFTSELMPEFYKNIFKEKLSKDEALSKAKLQLFKTRRQDIYHQHPFFWASFCLFGEPRGSERIPFLNRNTIFVFLLIMTSIFIILIFFIKAIRTKNSPKTKA